MIIRLRWFWHVKKGDWKKDDENVTFRQKKRKKTRETKRILLDVVKEDVELF